jgi:aldehyde dehydrogenase (NAD(P)+)
MPSASPKMSADARSAAPTDTRALDEAIAVTRSRAREFARLAPAAKAALARDCVARMLEAAPAWVADGARARDARPAEEWLSAVMPALRQFRLFAETLEHIAARGRPPLGAGTRTRADGRLEISVLPTSVIDRVSFAGFSGYALMPPGVDAAAARERQAAFYRQRDPEGGVAVILGAGNVASIPPMDVGSKLFIDGRVCVLKMNPVNEWVGPHLERALAPLIARGYVRIVYGGAEVGNYLVEHRDIDEVHITGSDRTHDVIVWGPPGPERERRMAANDPVLKVPITSELGNVSPVAIVPYTYTDDELWFCARNVVTMVVNNASFNCNAAKMLVTAAGWPQRDAFLGMIAKGLSSVRPRRAYYPGAQERYQTLLDGHRAEQLGRAGDGELPWALVRGLDAGAADEPLFRVEPFCAILSETQVGSADPVEFLDAATRFLNDRLWGTLNAAVMVHPALERDPVVGAALDRAVVALRYGVVAINHWPAVAYALGSLPWGAYPGSTPANIQSGIGWVHNSYMLDGMEKAVLRGPLTVFPKPIWFYDNDKAEAIAPRAAKLEADPRWWRLPGLIARSL